MTIHKASHPLSRQTVRVGGENFILEDWWDKVSGGISWMFCDGNFACLNYAIHSATLHTPIDDEVVYGKINGLGYIVHVSEIEAS